MIYMSYYHFSLGLKSFVNLLKSVLSCFSLETLRLWQSEPFYDNFLKNVKKSIKALQRVTLGFVIVWRKREQLGFLWCESSAAGVCAALIIMTMQDGAMVSVQWKKTILL